MIENKTSLPAVSPGVHTVPVEKGLTTMLIGRQEELGRLVALCEKQVNTILLGPQGIGKSFLLDNLVLDQVIRIGLVSSHLSDEVRLVADPRCVSGAFGLGPAACLARVGAGDRRGCRALGV